VKFLRVPIAEATGCVLAHNVFDDTGKRVLKKGAFLSAHDARQLQQLGRGEVYVAQLEASDVDENDAARRVAAAVAGANVFSPGAATGRANLKATAAGLLRVNVEAVDHLNEIDDGVTLATLPTYSWVGATQMVATVKIIPFAVARQAVAAVEKFSQSTGAIITVQALPQRRVGLIVTASQFTSDSRQHERLAADFAPALRARVERYGSAITQTDFAEHETLAIVQKIAYQLSSGCEMIVIVSMTAIIDRHDVVPTAIEKAGGRVAHFGVPVDPGNLLLVGYCGAIPVIGAPGCVRSLKINAFDLVLPRLLAGEWLARRDLIRFGHGGLLEEIRERHLLREAIDKLP
jgi:molybdenum cofactor cytidylyltransferase